MQTSLNLAQQKAQLSENKRALLEKQLQAKATRVFAAEPVPAAPAGPAPLSFAQQRLWFLYQLAASNIAYNVPTALRLQGVLHVPLLERAIDGIVERHQILRTRFDMVDGQPVQVVVPRLNGHAVEVHNLSHLSVAAQEAEILHLAQAEGRKPFDLAGGPLLRVTLLVLGERDHVLLFTLHHIIADGWSAGILFREFAALYRAYGEGRPAPLADLPLQYRDFAHWQRGWMQGERLERLIAYWRKTLEGAPPLLELPIDYPRPSLQSDSGATHAFRLPPALLDPLRALSRQHGVTLFVTLVSAFNVLLHRYSGQADICLGASVANRGRPEFEALIGLFANMLVLRGDLSGNPRFVELLQRMQAVCVGALGHQDLPFEKLVEALNPVRDRSYSPFFQVVFVLHNLPAGAPEVAGLTIQPLEIDFGTAKSDLTLHVTERDGIAAVFEYSTDLFEPATIVRMAAHLTRLLEDVVARPQCRLNELSLLGAGEYRQLLGWSAPTEEAIPANALLHADFEAQARKHPERIALRCGTEQLCYGELDRRANQLAHYLLAHGVGPEVNVGLCLERSPEAIVGLLGILKAGGAYVPLAPDYPPARIAELLADCGAALLLTQQRLAAALPGAMPCTVINGGFVPPLPPGEGWGEGNPNNAIDDRARHSLSTLCLDRDWPKVAAQPEQRPPARARPANAAYLIYTSGSTGAPKGVLVSHANAAASTAARFRFYPAAPGGFLLLSPFAFDSSVAGIFWTLSGGGTLCIPPESSRRDPGAIAALCAAAAPSHLLCLPSLYEPLLELARPGQLDSLQGVIVAGETCPASLVTRHFERLPAARLYNEYGPTEGTVWCSVHEISAADAAGPPIPIGRPIAGARLFILDAALNPAPTGIVGELYIGGAGIARGYHGRPAATAERFVPAPFAMEPGARLYRSGDRARFRADGAIEFLGRIDHQVKMRGFRIELGEIEARLRRHAGVREAVVIVREDHPGAQRLVAYFVPAAGVATPESLREFLKAALPDYMVPALFVPLEALPLNHNGKLDLHALPQPEPAAASVHPAAVPHNALEAQLAAIWAELLGVAQIGIHDNFFDLGGHSLSAIQLVVRLQEQHGADLSVADVFEAPTIAELASLLQRQAGARQEVDEILKALEALPADEAERLLSSFAGSAGSAGSQPPGWEPSLGSSGFPYEDGQSEPSRQAGAQAP